MICLCGNTEFYAHQRVYMHVVIDEHNVFVSTRDGSGEPCGIYHADTPYGPYRCTKCGKEYEEIINSEKYDTHYSAV